ncbi:MAG: hypothetical protein J0H31_14585 [Alphaproteobacteria bacterium]|nr:hypothetical protein [Alphaproteobacteria bacterium]
MSMNVIRRMGTELVARLVEQEKRIDAHCMNIHTRRNRVIAHLDFRAVLKKDNETAPVVEMKEIDDFLVMASAFLNEIVNYYHRYHRIFKPIITGPSRAIVYRLKKSHTAHEEEMRRLKERM